MTVHHCEYTNCPNIETRYVKNVGRWLCGYHHAELRSFVADWQGERKEKRMSKSTMRIVGAFVVAIVSLVSIFVSGLVIGAQGAEIDSAALTCEDGRTQAEDEYRRSDGVCVHREPLLSELAGWSAVPTTEPGAVAHDSAAATDPPADVQLPANGPDANGDGYVSFDESIELQSARTSTIDDVLSRRNWRRPPARLLGAQFDRINGQRGWVTVTKRSRVSFGPTTYVVNANGVIGTS